MTPGQVSVEIRSPQPNDIDDLSPVIQQVITECKSVGDSNHKLHTCRMVTLSQMMIAGWDLFLGYSPPKSTGRYSIVQKVEAGLKKTGVLCGFPTRTPFLLEYPPGSLQIYRKAELWTHQDSKKELSTKTSSIKDQFKKMVQKLCSFLLLQNMPSIGNLLFSCSPYPIGKLCKPLLLASGRPAKTVWSEIPSIPHHK